MTAGRTDADGVTRSPPVRSAVVAGSGFALAVAALAVAGSPLATAVAAVGGTAAVAGSFRGSRSALGVGTATLLAAVLVAAVITRGALAPLVAAGAAVAAWDVGENGLTLGEQVGRGARTRQAEVTRAAVSGGVALAAVGLGFVVFRTATGRQPLAALVLLLVSAVVLATVLRA